MYLKSLEILGFKSFAERTVFEFHQGVTGIVGPNGCGKSNVVDAIRWVLGETSAKALRGGEMADVIFNGTERRKPLGMAEVTLTMADCEEALKVDYNEVSITRRVFRDGKGEYRINGTLCRLKDIHDMFMDTGIGRTAYSIMAQGQIDQILSSKPEERRTVFEEAAGITKYKREKKEALRKLEYTEANLLRVGDVLAEQERRMNSLKRQVAKARRYQSLAGDVRVLDTHLAHRRFTELTAEREELRVSMESLERREHEIERQIPAREEEVVEARHVANAFEAELAGLRQQWNEHRNQLTGAQNRMVFNDERRAELEARIAQNREDIETTRQKLAQQEFDFQVAHEALEGLTRRIVDQEAQLATQEERTRVARGDRERIEAALREARAEANRTQTLIASTQARIESAVAQLEGTRERARQLAEEEQRLLAQLEEATAVRANIESEVAAAVARITESDEGFRKAERAFQHARGDLDAARTAAADSHKLLAQRGSRLDVVRQLVASGEGFENGTRQVLGGLDDPERFGSGIHGVLASYLEADNTCARAIEAALGRHLQAVLVRDAGLAGAIVERLTEQRLGVAAVLPEEFIGTSAGTQMLTVPEGAVGWALDRVKVDKRIAAVVEKLLENVLVVPDMATALRMRTGLPGVSFATTAGEFIGAEGIVHGGVSGEGGHSLLERQNEVRALEAEVAELTEADARARDRVSELERQVAALQEEMEASRDRLQQQRVEHSTVQGQLGLATREVESFETKIENVTWERGELVQREQSAAAGRRSLEGELLAARQRLEAGENDQRRLQAELEAALRCEAELAEALGEIRTSLAVERRARQAAEEQQRPMEARLNELRELTERRQGEIASFEQRVAAAIAENKTLADQCTTLQDAADQLENEITARGEERSQINAAIETAEAALDNLRREHAKVAEQKGREEVAATKLDLRCENLVESMLERHQLDLAAFEPDAHALLASVENQRKQQARRAARAAAGEEANGESEANDTDNVVDEPPVAAAAVLDGLPGEPDWDFVEMILADLKRRLESMGPVNVDAIEEYEELEERYQFLRAQHDDLVNSKRELLEVIEKINEETQRRFAETFDEVRKNFRTMFRELFGEQGKADLMLVDENDPLESGIEVIAKPPGKKLQSISLLSGGERSMTAVALLFSIYMIKPSPFCVLDELDAPLDEANIGRFLRVLDRFIAESQFIIVTHSKRTMARADVMYGVTMEEFGISKPVGMRLTRAGEAESSGDAKTAAQKAALKLNS